MTSNNYCEYFNIDEAYFPCIDESAINAGARWDTTYPHETFIELLNSVEKMLGGTTRRSIWIHGAYGTGKSQCAYAIKKILEISENELRTYWSKYEPLKKNNILLEKLIGHKQQGVLTAYRYASGSITTPQQLFFAIQESIQTSLSTIHGSYKGENTLKESVITWLEDPFHNNFINSLLQKPEWVAEFSQSTADEIINTLKKSSEVSGLIESIFKLAAKEGITALTLTADSLCKWISDVIKNNHTKIVLIWDEFSGFFRQNRNSLDEFQKIVSLCEDEHTPFYFIIVTHPITSIAGTSISKDDPMSVVQQRYNKIEITLPSNIAFQLTGHAFSVIEAAKPQWELITNDLSAKVTSSKTAVMKATDVKSDTIMQNMLPIHPMAALILKNIASAFQSNQRSMFDFIKTPKDLDVHAFQWFIQNTSPISDRPLLTIDMLWDFFYEKGKEYLSSDIKVILDTFPQQTNLNNKEKIILKTILIMQAVDQRLGGSISVLKPTDQNLSYAFEGDWDELENECISIAKGLVNKGILILTPIAEGKKVYSAAILAGDGAKIDKYKDEIRKTSTISKLIDEGPALASALNLTPALRLRFTNNQDTGYLPIATISTFAKIVDSLKSKDVGWHFIAILALAKTEEEAQTFRIQIKNKITNPDYKNIIIIDALSTPLGLEEFNRYIDYSAMSMYYQGNNSQQAKDNSRKAKEVLEHTWRERIQDGQFIIWTHTNQDGEKATGAASVHTILQTIVLNRFKYVPDFTKGLTETQLKLTNPKQVSKYGMATMEVKGLIAGCEKSVLGTVWNHKKYWEDPLFEKENISIIKKALTKMIEESFKSSGRISINEIYDFLETTYGYSACNLTAFIVGFLLKEYSSDPYRSQDSEGHRESMTPDKLSEMIGNYMNKKIKTTYIVSLTPEEKAFYELTETVWNIAPNSCSSPTQAGLLIQNKMRNFVYPVWTLEEVDNFGVYDIIKKYITLIQSDGISTHKIAKEIGEIAIQRKSIEKNLAELLTAENCQKGMSIFLEHFDGRKLLSLAEEIGATNRVLGDIKKLFNVKHSAQWVSTTGEDEIRKLTVEYEFVKLSNMLLNVSNNNKDSSFASWRDQLKFIGFSCEAIQAKKPNLNKLFNALQLIVNHKDILSDNLNQIVENLSAHCTEIQDIFNDSVTIFQEIYQPYLSGFTTEECEKIRNSITENMFILSATKSNSTVKKAAEDYRKNQLKTQLFKLWNDKTHGTKNPRQWSQKYQTPILCCIAPSIYSEAKKTFSVLNSSIQSESEIKSALAFLENANFFDQLENLEHRNQCFTKQIMGHYTILLPDIQTVRNELDTLAIDPYDWLDDPRIKRKIIDIATAEYYAGKSDNIIKTIDTMNENELRNWLKKLINEDMELGIRIITNGGQ